MKKLEKVYEGRTLTCSTGKAGTQDFKQLAISAREQEDGSFVFAMVKTTGIIRMTTETKEVARVLREMRAYAPKQSDWKVSRKVKEAADETKVKSGKAEAAKPERIETVAIRKGRS